MSEETGNTVGTNAGSIGQPETSRNAVKGTDQAEDGSESLRDGEPVPEDGGETLRKSGRESAELAREVLALVKLRVLTQYRYLAKAIERLKPVPGMCVSGGGKASGADDCFSDGSGKESSHAEAVFQTDGRFLYYDVERLLENYRRDPYEVSRDVLHTLLHCLLGHMYQKQKKDPALWDLACDLAVEGILAGLQNALRPVTDREGGQCAPHGDRESRTPYEKDVSNEHYGNRNRLKRLEFERLTQAAGGTSAPVLYRYLTGCIRSDSGIRHENGIRRDSEDSMQVSAESDDPAELYVSAESDDPAELYVSAESDDPAELYGPAETNALAELFYRDSHACWYAGSGGRTAGGRRSRRAKSGQDGGTDAGNREKPAPRQPDAEETDDCSDQSGEEETGESSDQSGEEETGDFSDQSREEEDRSFFERDSGRETEEWEELCREVRAKDRIGRHRSAVAGKERQRLSVEENGMDYREFLEQFGAWEETIAVSQEEFDLVYYEYGLRCYGNIPLIEPLEYRDDHKIREFVIAIDTSGSVLGEQIRDFISQTFAVLRQPDFFCGQSRIHVIQCDAKIQEVTLIEGAGGTDGLRETFDVKGFGGTDFVPVFEHIAREREEGRMERPQGLLYFTDGLGTYPEHEPDYPVAFLLRKQAYRLPDVPEWAVKAVMDGDRIVIEK